MFTTEFLQLAGFDTYEIGKYQQHRQLKKAGRKVDKVTRRVYLKVSEGAKAYEEKLAKAPKVRRREDFEAARWCVNTVKADEENLQIPFGFTTLHTVFFNEWHKVIVEGIDGMVPFCDTIDNTKRNNVFAVFDELQVLFAEDAVYPEFDGVTFQKRVAELMGLDYDTKWDADYQSYRPQLFEVAFVRLHILPLVREAVRQACLANYRFRAA
jgi:hypothetical protein